MGGKGSGRLNKTDSFIKNIRSDPFNTVSGDVAQFGGEPLVIPNHSGITNHVEFKNNQTCVNADKYDSIQEAINDLPATGGCVQLSAKTYTIDSPITISTSNVTLKGVGKASIIQTTSAVNAIEISGDDIYYCVLRDFTIDGNSTGLVGLYLDSNATTADEPFFLVENIRIHDMASHGISTTNSIQETWISMCRIRDCGGHGMRLDGYDHKLIQCVISECADEGFFMPSTSSNIKLTQCKAYNNDNGFVMEGDGHFYLTQCQAQENQNRGFIVRTGSGNEKMVSLVGCVADGNYLSGTGGAGEGLRVTGRNEVHVIGGEYSKSGGAGNQTYGIRITGSSDKCVVIGVEMSGNATAQYSDEGSGTNQILACVGHTDDNLADHDLTTTGEVSGDQFIIKNTDGVLTNDAALSWNETISTTEGLVDFLSMRGTFGRPSSGSAILRAFNFSTTIDFTNISNYAGTVFQNAGTNQLSRSTNTTYSENSVFSDSRSYVTSNANHTFNTLRTVNSNTNLTGAAGATLTVGTISGLDFRPTSVSGNTTITNMNGYNFAPLAVSSSGTNWSAMNLSGGLYIANNVTNFRQIWINNLTTASAGFTNHSGIFSQLVRQPNTYFIEQQGSCPSYFEGDIEMIDSIKLQMGTGLDYEIYYDGTDAVHHPDAVGSGNLKILGTSSWTANGTVATTLTSVGPTGANTTVQEWLTIKNAAGTTRYIPCF